MPVVLNKDLPVFRGGTHEASVVASTMRLAGTLRSQARHDVFDNASMLL